MAGTKYRGSEIVDVDQFLNDADGLVSEREKEIGQHIGYRYDVNLVPDYGRITPFLTKYMEVMGWDDLNWLEDVHMGYEEGAPAVFDRNNNGWVRIPNTIELPDNQQEVIRLKFQNDLSYREISEITGLSVSNVGFLLHVGIKRLREIMKND